MSVFEGDITKRYDVVWSNSRLPNPRPVGNAGAAGREGFVESLKEGGFILIWARARVRHIQKENRLPN
jgi:hypothetical protein